MAIMREAYLSEQYPQGKLSEHDEGELAVAIALVGDSVVINFTKPIHWIGLGRDRAISFAQSILAHATMIAPKGPAQ